MDKLQHIYDKHAKDFGLSGRKNQEQLNRLREVLDKLVHNEQTHHIRGWYRGQQAKIFLETSTRNVVVTTLDDELIAAYRASEAQAGYIRSTGRLN